ncbi:TBC1 domain family member 14 isoform X1, partial [Silurus meridionalis]
GLHAGENGSVSGPGVPDLLHGVCVTSTPLYCGSPRSTPCGEEEQDSVESQDSGIPTLELSSPEVTDESHGAEASGPRRDTPATLKLETIGEGGASSQAPVRGGALTYRDSTSVCSTSSLSTDFSATLSLGNEDTPGDFVVTSDSSAVVDFHDFSDFSGFSQAPPTNSKHEDLAWHGEGAPRKESPIVSFFNRRLFSKKPKDMNTSPSARSEPSFKLFSRDSPKHTQQFLKVRFSRDYGRDFCFTFQNTKKPRPLIIHAGYKIGRERESEREREKYMRRREEKDERQSTGVSASGASTYRRLHGLQLTRSSCQIRDNVRGVLPGQRTNRTGLLLSGTQCSSKRVRDLWWQGIPPSVRGRVWALAIGNELNITHELYDICLARAKEKWSASPQSVTAAEGETGDVSHADREASLELIKLDISRTFPSLCIFQKVINIKWYLSACLSNYLSFCLSLYLFQYLSVCLCISVCLSKCLSGCLNIFLFRYLSHSRDVLGFFFSQMLTYFAAFEVFFEDNLPKLFAHFKSNNLTPDIYLIDWIFTLYSKSVPLDVACRVWDVFCRDGEEFLFRTALGILRFYSDVLANMDFIHMAQFLSRLPEQISTHTQSHTLFSCISSINMSCRNRTWTQVLQALQKETEHSSPVLK